MTRLRSAGLLGVAIVAFSSESAGARTRPSDVAATRAYLKAQYSEVRADAVAYRAGIKAVEALGARVGVECPGVLAAEPHPAAPNRVETEISEEVFNVILRTPERAQHPAIERFARFVRRLRWSDRKLTRLAHSYAAERAARSGIPLPNLCADLQAWVASGYKTVSASTTQYLHRLGASGTIGLVGSGAGAPAANTTIARMLAGYEDQADRAIIRRIKRFEARQQPSVGNAFLSAAGKVTHALHTPPGSA